jgi:putative ABC transport system permease protein
MSALRRISRSLWRFHRLVAGVLILEYALTFAILLTALGVLLSRAGAINEHSGIVEQGLYVLQGRGVREPVHRFQLDDARARFAAVVGMRNVATGSSAPFLGMNSQKLQLLRADAAADSDPLSVSAYDVGQRFATVLGLRLLRGRWFRADEVARRYDQTTHVVILSRSLARALFHGGRALGRQVDIVGKPHTVIGVMNALAAPQYLGNRRTSYTVLMPRIDSSRNLLLIRNGGPVRALQDVLATLRKRDAGQVRWSLTSYADVRAAYFRTDRWTVAALGGVVMAVLITALCGMLGLTNYWVTKRRPQIAIRRALGARKRDIQVEFLMETAVLATSGLLLGATIKICLDAAMPELQTPRSHGMWACSVSLLLLVALFVVATSLRRWQRMSPSQLMRLN